LALPADAATDDLAQFVNPYIGTKPGGPDQGTGGGAGNTFPGADVPFGMVQWSPDTVTHQHGGYYYPDNRLKGFSLTHLSGAGCATYEDIPFMPFVGEVTTSPAADPNRYIANFSHANETTTPGYYGVTLDSGAKVELSATQRTGIGRIKFPSGPPATLLVNTSGSVAGTDDAEINIGTDTITGWATSGRFCGVDHRYRVYFAAQFDRPFESIGTWKNGTVTLGRSAERGGSPAKVDLAAVDAPKTGQRKPAPVAKTLDTTVSGPGSGGYVTFDSFSDDTVNVRVGLSFVSIYGARGNLAAESGTKTFDQVKDAARAEWNTRLNAVKVTGGSADERTTFYTALYHSLLQPNVFSDADGKYAGFDGRVHTADSGHAVYTNFSGWDIYRSEAQLLALIAPKEMSDIARSMIAFAEQGGSWDRWTVANGYTGVMNGDPYHIIVSTAYAFGAKDFDASKALLLMLRGATQPTQGYTERPGLDDYQKLGYIPMGSAGVWGPVATTLEYTSADFAISELARRLGDSATWSTFVKRAQNWQNVYNNGYLQTRNKDGSFTQPFNPASSDGYVEGNAAQYAWMVPYDPRGLFNSMGGDATVVNRLDTFFTQLNAGPSQPYAFMGNEPNAQVPWLYNYAGAPYKTQATTRRVITELYNPHEDGLVGNDDLGQMSSWYVWAAMGLYPMIPGRSELVLNGPLFEQVVITRPTGATLTINGNGAGTKQPYITGVNFNGHPSTRTWLPESFVDKGGTVDFTMSATAAPTWGSAPTDAPPSFRDGEVGQRGYVDPPRIVMPAGSSAFVEIGAQDISGNGAKVQWTAPPPPGISMIPGGGELTVPPVAKASRSIAVRVEPDTPEATYKVNVSFTGPSGPLQGAVIQILVAKPGSLRASFNNVGISPDSSMSVANFDNVGFSYSANALSNVGVKPGAMITVDGLAHTWPITDVGEPDNVIAGGQTVNVTAPAGATKLALLGSAANGSASGTMTITYTDGTTAQAAIGFSDWTLGGGGQTPSFDNRIAAASSYRNSTNGTTQGIKAYVFATAPVPLDGSKQLKSITLPSSVSGGSLHVFAVTAG
jgi:predicted alpha-1,2-mannosidase